MKQTFAQLAIAIPLIFFSTVVGAYTPPGSAPTGNNTNVDPVSITANDQAKRSSLSVNTFNARNNASFQQVLTIKGIVRGGLPPMAAGPTTSIVKIGGDVNGTMKTVGATVTGMVATEKHFQSDTLKNSTNSLKPVCATPTGEIVHCPTGNQSGNQVFLGSVSGASSKQVACQSLSNTARSFYKANSAPFPLTGEVVYDDAAHSFPFNGNSLTDGSPLWYHMNYQSMGASATSSAVKINGSGVVLEHQSC